MFPLAARLLSDSCPGSMFLRENFLPAFCLVVACLLDRALDRLHVHQTTARPSAWFVCSFIRVIPRGTL